MIKNNHIAYGSLSQFLHWLIFLLVLILIPWGYFMDDVGNKLLRGEAYNLHKLLGLIVLVLMLIRVAWMLMNPKPALPANTSRLAALLAHAMHGTLYLLLIAMPLSGWVMSAAAGRAPHYFSWTINLPIAKNETLASWGASIHEILAILIIACVVLHALAALAHHFILKDDVLKRMLPHHPSLDKKGRL